MKTGQVDRLDQPPRRIRQRPARSTFGEVFATLYHNLGIDPRRRRSSSTRPAGRSTSVDHEPLRELV